jgi:hypothetical protein
MNGVGQRHGLFYILIFVDFDEHFLVQMPVYTL